MINETTEKYLTENFDKDKRINLKDLSTAQFTKIAEVLAKSKDWTRQGGGTMLIFYLTKKGKADNVEDEVRLVLHQSGKWELVGDIRYMK